MREKATMLEPCVALLWANVQQGKQASKPEHWPAEWTWNWRSSLENGQLVLKALTKPCSALRPIWAASSLPQLGAGWTGAAHSNDASGKVPTAQLESRAIGSGAGMQRTKWERTFPLSLLVSSLVELGIETETWIHFHLLAQRRESKVKQSKSRAGKRFHNVYETKQHPQQEHINQAQPILKPNPRLISTFTSSSCLVAKRKFPRFVWTFYSSQDKIKIQTRIQVTTTN